MAQPLIGAVEGGGTSFELGVGQLEDGAITWLARRSVVTGNPSGTLADVRAFFAPHPIAGIGVACFGPLDVERGLLLDTPKRGWPGADLHFVRPVERDVGVCFDTDVNAAAVAELARADRGVRALAYVTVGTGVGVGFARRGEGGAFDTLRNLLHPELGHVRSPARDDFVGVCEVHGNCVEGLASGRAIKARLGIPPEELPGDHPVFDLVAEHLGELAAIVALAYAPDAIVFGGGVLRRPLVPAIERAYWRRLGGYPARRAHLRAARTEDAGLEGALRLAAARL